MDFEYQNGNIRLTTIDVIDWIFILSSHVHGRVRSHINVHVPFYAHVQGHAKTGRKVGSNLREKWEQTNGTGSGDEGVEAMGNKVS